MLPRQMLMGFRLRVLKGAFLTIAMLELMTGLRSSFFSLRSHSTGGRSRRVPIISSALFISMNLQARVRK